MPLTALVLLAALCAPDTEVSVTLVGGETVHGTTDLTAVELTTSFGRATVNLAEIRSIAIAGSHTVVTRDGTSLTGTLTLAAWPMTVAGKRERYGLDRLQRIAIVSRAKLVPGTITEGSASNGLTYCVRLPEGWTPKSSWPALLVFHGSNMNTTAYVHTIAQQWPKLAADYVLLGINGELRNPRSDDDNPAYNYTYVNWVGERSTMRGTNPDESPKFIMEALTEIQGFLPLARIFVGGHSQGGFLTWTLFMHFPEAFAGAFPMSCGMIVQAEPDVFTDASIRTAQRARPIAVIHGRDDDVVDFSMSEWATEACIDDGFPLLRLFAPTGPGHRFALLPLEEAVRWLEAMASEDPAALVRTATTAVAEQRWRDAIAAAQRAAALGNGKTAKALAPVLAAIDRVAKPEATRLEQAMAKAGDRSWVDAFLEFRAEHGFAEAAKGVCAAYRALREAQAKEGNELYWAARREFQQQHEDAAYAKCQELVERCYATRWYRVVKGWLDKRGK